MLLNSRKCHCFIVFKMLKENSNARYKRSTPIDIFQRGLLKQKKIFTSLVEREGYIQKCKELEIQMV